jgi:hypothetical protein
MKYQTKATSNRHNTNTTLSIIFFYEFLYFLIRKYVDIKRSTRRVNSHVTAAFDAIFKLNIERWVLQISPVTSDVKQLTLILLMSWPQPSSDIMIFLSIIHCISSDM